MARAVGDLDRSVRDRTGEAMCLVRRHDVALRAGDHLCRALDAPEEGERVDGLGGEHAPVPAKPPAALDVLDCPLGEELELLCVEV
jgi:hypothetical protein